MRVSDDNKTIRAMDILVRAGWGDTVPALLRNGDWDYALFAADGSRRDGLNQAPCLACHKPLAADSFNRSSVWSMSTIASAIGGTLAVST